MRLLICTHCGHEYLVPSQPPRRIATCRNCNSVGTVRYGPNVPATEGKPAC